MLPASAQRRGAARQFEPPVNDKYMRRQTFFGAYKEMKMASRYFSQHYVEARSRA